MERIILILIFIVTMIILYIIFNIKINKIKEAGKNKSLDEIANKFPDNKEICKVILKKLKNGTVNIKEDNNNKSSLYIALTNTIIIANIKDSYTRIQTIAHECLHSIQSKRLLIFNYIYSNIYITYFIIISILTLLGIVKNYYIQITILTLMGFIYFLVRNYLENDAMIKAEYLAKEYMEEIAKQDSNITIEEVECISKKYNEINKIGIPATNLLLFCNCLIKIIIYLIIVLFK